MLLLLGKRENNIPAYIHYKWHVFKKAFFDCWFVECVDVGCTEAEGWLHGDNDWKAITAYSVLSATRWPSYFPQLQHHNSGFKELIQDPLEGLWVPGLAAEASVCSDWLLPLITVFFFFITSSGILVHTSSWMHGMHVCACAYVCVCTYIRKPEVSLGCCFFGIINSSFWIASLIALELAKQDSLFII